MTSNLKSHPSNAVLECYSLGNLSETELERVEEHLFVCAQCQNELSSIDTYIGDMKYGCRETLRQMATQPGGLLGRLGPLFTLPRPVLAGACAALVLAVVLPVMRFQTALGVPAEVELATSRGAGSPGAHAAARRPLLLQLDGSTLPASGTFRAEVVNHGGSTVWSGPAVHDGVHLSFAVRRSLAAGTYWVRLYDSGDDLVREYGLELK